MVRVGNSGTCNITSYRFNNVSCIPPQSGVAGAIIVVSLAVNVYNINLWIVKCI